MLTPANYGPMGGRGLEDSSNGNLFCDLFERVKRAGESVLAEYPHIY